METGTVLNAFTQLTEDVRLLTERRNELAVTLHNVLAAVSHDDAYLATVAKPGESMTGCCERLIREARSVLSRAPSESPVKRLQIRPVG